MSVNMELVIGGLILLMTGTAILIGLVSAFLKGPIDWKNTMGVIEESTAQAGDDSPTAFAVFRFKFLVGDQPYWGNEQIWKKDLAAARELVDQLPIKAGAIVYFDPTDPENESTLVKPRKDGKASMLQSVWGVVVISLLTAIPFVIGGLLLYWGLNEN